MRQETQKKGLLPSRQASVVTFKIQQRFLSTVFGLLMFQYRC